MPDPDLAKQFAGKMLNIYTGAVLTKLIDIGYQTGLFEASKLGPASSEELSERAGLNERYVREWLGAMTTGGIYTFEAATQRYTLPEEHAVALTGEGASNLCPASRIINHFGTHLPALTRCFRSGGGISYSAYRPVFTQCMDDSWRRVFDQHLVAGFIGAVPGLSESLRRGIAVLDVGCGTGHAMNILAREFPASNFTGYDIAEDAIASASAEAQQMGLTNSRFEIADVARLPDTPKFDLITAFDAIHDQVAPDAVLRGISHALKAGATFLMVDFKFSSKVEENVGNPFAAMHYGFSLMHCMPVSLAHGGAGLGTVWGQQLAQRMLAEAGFGSVEILDTPRPQNCSYVCRHAAATAH